MAFSLLSLALPVALATLLTRTYGLTLQQHRLTKSFSLLLLGMFLSSLATLNFSLAFLVGLLASPLTFVVAPPPASPPSSASPSLVSKVGWWLSLVTCVVASPTTIVAAAAEYSGFGLAHLLAEAAFGWDVWRMYTAVVVWCVWWPAWLVGATLVLSRPAGVVGTPAKEKRAA